MFKYIFGKLQNLNTEGQANNFVIPVAATLRYIKQW